MTKYSVIGIGGPILDQVLQIDEAYLSQVPGKKAGMEPIDYETLEDIIIGSGKKPITVLGGSARNTLHGLSRFGEKCALIGMRGSDERGETYSQLLKEQGIDSLLVVSSTPTATVLSLVTPDGERTMRTFQGASTHMRGMHLNPQDFSGVRLVHLEGYTLYNQDLTEAAMSIAQEEGAKVSFDLASFEITRQFKDHILYLLDNYVDIVFCNEQEAFALTGLCEEESCDFLAECCEVSVVLLGPRGCWVRRGNNKGHCPAYPVQPVDTTGAGDLFASGFLHGYLQGYPLQICAHYGAIAGRAVVQVIGAEIPHERWVEIFSQLKNS